MTPRRLITFCRSTTGSLLIFILLLASGILLMRNRARPAEVTPVRTQQKREDTQPRKPQLVQTVTREMTPLTTPKAAPQSPPVPPEPVPLKPKKPEELPPISLYSGTPESGAAIERPGAEYAPFGRLVQCELVVTVDSSTIQTPIIGLVTDDIWHDGSLIIPAGTEVHSSARVDRVRERIASAGEWTFVWQSGEELKVSGIALDREKDGEAGAWGVTDGSAGLGGELLKTDDLAEIKLFAASFLNGAAGALTDRQTTVFGTQSTSALQNAPILGAQQVLSAYAKQILNSIQRDGFFVRVPAGKQFYVYVTQTLDKSRAAIGGTRSLRQDPLATESLGPRASAVSVLSRGERAEPVSSETFELPFREATPLQPVTVP